MGTYLIEQEPLTSIALEAELGLNRGDIARIIIYPTGAVEVETNISLSATKQTLLKDALAKRNLPRGKKPQDI